MSERGEKLTQDGNMEHNTTDRSIQEEGSATSKRQPKLSKAERIALRNQESVDNSLSSKIDYLSVHDDSTQSFGEYQLIQSHGTTANSGQVFASVSGLDKKQVGKQVWIRARVDTIRPKGRNAFLVLRHSQHTVQAVVSESDRVSRNMVKWITKEVGEEYLIDVYGSVVAADVKSCSQHDVELCIWKLYIVSKVKTRLPIRVEDAGRPDWMEGVHVLRDTRLDNRVLDLRVPSQQAIFRIQSAVCQLFREILLREGFIEIHSPKIIAGASEGGAEVFKLNYFGQDACLAQSPQLYKQMAICADLERVFEIGPVFRAENSYTHRHLCEFTGLDIEMAIREHYFEVIDILELLFIGIFEGIRQRFATEIELVQQKFQISPMTYLPAGQNPRLQFPEAVQLLRDNGYMIEDLEDLSTENEKALGKIIKEKYGTDFYTLTGFPAAVRPFYTMPKADDSRYSNSFDMFLRGEEIVSGAQRIHDSELLEHQVKARNIPLSSIEDYLNAFKYGTPPHGGAGIGLERVVMLYLGVGNIRECSMFPRDPKRNCCLADMEETKLLQDKYGFSLEDYSFLFESQPKECTQELSPADIDGNIPKDIVGSYFLNGPGLLHIDGDWFHPFDGHGFIRSLTFRGDGSCLYRSKFVKTEAYLEETSAGHGVYRGFGRLSGGWWRNFRAKIFKVPANTCVIDWANNLLCLHEGGLPYALDPETLETKGTYRFQDSLAENASILAHTRLDSENNRLLGCSVVPGRHTRIMVYEFCSDGALYSKIEHSISGLCYIHDFCFTENFYIFISSYLRMKPLSLMKALIGLQSLPTAVTSDNWKSAQLFVIPRRDSKHLVEPMVFSLDEPLFTIHLGNAHEKDNRLVIYTCSFKTFSIGNELGYYPCRPGYFNPLANGGGAPQCLLRIDVDWKRNQLNKKWVDFSACDFPEVHPYQEVSEEKKNVGFFIKHGNRAVVKYDLDNETKEIWQCGERDFIGEAVFIPKRNAQEEDDGYLIAAIYRSQLKQVDFAIFDSKQIANGPLCCIHSPQHFPYGFHGSFSESRAVI